MNITDHLRLAFPGRPFSACGDEVIFDDGLPMPDEAELAATHDAALAAWQTEQLAAATPPPVTRRQLMHLLHGRGWLEAVPALIASIPDELARKLAWIDWDTASVFEVGHPLVAEFAAALHLTRDQLHDAWREAAQIL